MKKLNYLILFIFSVAINASAPVCDLSQFYDDSGTCEVMRAQLGTNDIITQVREERISKLRKEIGSMLVKKAKKVTRSLGVMDHLFQINNLNSNDNKLNDVPECSLSSISEVSCSGSEYFKEIFSEISGNISNSSDLSIGLSGSFSQNSIVNINKSTEGLSCMNPALLREIAWNSESIQNILNSNKQGEKFINSLNAIKLSGDSNLIDHDHDFINQMYPSFFEDIIDGRIKFPTTYSSGSLKEIFKSILSSNTENIKNKQKQQCISLKEMMEKGICKTLEGPQLNDPVMSARLFDFDSRGHESGFDKVLADENFEDVDSSFKHFAASCFEKVCDDDTCLDINDFMLEYFPNGEANTLNSVDTDTGLSSDDEINKNQCKQLNCSNHEAMIADGNLSCVEREAQSIPALKTEFSCDVNPTESICQTLVIVERSRQRPLSTFSRTVLGQEATTTIVASAADPTRLSIDTGIDEEASVSLETPYERGERSYEPTNTTNTTSVSTPEVTATRASTARTPSNENPAPANSVREQRRSSAARNNQPIVRETLPPEFEPTAEADEDDLTDEETSLIGSLRDAISNTISDIGDAAKSAVTPSAQAPDPAVARAAARIGETRDTLDPRGAPVADTFSNDFRDNTLAVQPGDAPGSADRPEAEVVSGGPSAAVARSRVAAATATGGSRAIASAGTGAENTGYKSVDGVVLESISLTLGELETLDEASILELNIPVTEPFVIMVNVNGEDVPVKVNRIAQDGGYVLRPIIDSTNIVVEDQLRKAPVFASYFNSPVMRKAGLDAILDNN